MILLERNFYGHPLARLLWERQVEEALLKLGRSTKMFVHRKQGLFLSVFVDDTDMSGKKQNVARMRKNLMKNLDIDEPTSFLDHVYLGCAQRECTSNMTIIEQQKTRISAGATQKMTGMGKASREN